MGTRLKFVKELCHGHHKICSDGQKEVHLDHAVKHFKYVQGFEFRPIEDEYNYEVDRVIKHLKQHQNLLQD